MDKVSLTTVKRMTSSTAASTSHTGISRNSPGHHMTDEPRAGLIISSSKANGEALLQMCGK